MPYPAQNLCPTWTLPFRLLLISSYGSFGYGAQCRLLVLYPVGALFPHTAPACLPGILPEGRCMYARALWFFRRRICCRDNLTYGRVGCFTLALIWTLPRTGLTHILPKISPLPLYAICSCVRCCSIPHILWFACTTFTELGLKRQLGLSCFPAPFVIPLPAALTLRLNTAHTHTPRKKRGRTGTFCAVCLTAGALLTHYYLQFPGRTLVAASSLNGRFTTDWLPVNRTPTFNACRFSSDVEPAARTPCGSQQHMPFPLRYPRYLTITFGTHFYPATIAPSFCNTTPGACAFYPG